jgi:formate dehydrogenase subunit beta
MSAHLKLPVTGGGKVSDLRGFLASLLTGGVVEALLVPLALPAGGGAVQSLVRDPGRLSGLAPFAPVMPVQSARILSSLTFRDPEARVAALVRPCEERAAVELAKFLQVRLERLLLVTLDCPGTVEVRDWTNLSPDRQSEAIDAMMTGMRDGAPVLPAGLALREACRLCTAPSGQGDLAVALWGSDGTPGITLTVSDGMAAELLAKGIGSPAEEPTGRRTALDRVIAARQSAREEAWRLFREENRDLAALLDRFSACIRCRNCMEACPICYCRECVFKTPTFDHQPTQYFRWADRKGALRMPTDTLMFHVIRMAHMASSCINCGLCDSACPMNLPVSTLFGSMGERVRQLFGYVPGRDPKETPPVAVFREDELEEEH